jgi:hypothetical protein
VTYELKLIKILSVATLLYVVIYLYLVRLFIISLVKKRFYSNLKKYLVLQLSFLIFLYLGTPYDGKRAESAVLNHNK